MATRSLEMILRITTRVQGAIAGIESMNQQIDHLSQKVTIAGFQLSAMGAAGTAVFGGMIKQAVQIGSAYEQAMQEAKSIAGFMGKEGAEAWKPIDEQIRQIALHSKFTHQELAETVRLIVSAGVHGPSAINNMTEAATSLSAAIGTDVPKAVGLAISAVESFGAGLEDRFSPKFVTQVVDTLAAAQASSRIEARELQKFFMRMGGVAAFEVQSQEPIKFLRTMMAEFGAVNQVIGNGRVATTSYRQAWQKLIALPARQDISEVVEILKEQGLTLQDINPRIVGLTKASATLADTGILKARNALQLFGVAGLNALGILGQAPETVAAITRNMEASASAAERAEENMDTMQGSLIRLKDAMHGLAIETKDALELYGLRDMIDVVAEISRNMAHMVKENKGATASFLGLGVSISGAILGLGTGLLFFGGFIRLLQASRIGIVAVTTALKGMTVAFDAALVSGALLKTTLAGLASFAAAHPIAIAIVFTVVAWKGLGALFGAGEEAASAATGLSSGKYRQQGMWAHWLSNLLSQMGLGKGQEVVAQLDVVEKGSVRAMRQIKEFRKTQWAKWDKMMAEGRAKDIPYSAIIQDYKPVQEFRERWAKEVAKRKKLANMTPLEKEEEESRKEFFQIVQRLKAEAHEALLSGNEQLVEYFSLLLQTPIATPEDIQGIKAEGLEELRETLNQFGRKNLETGLRIWKAQYEQYLDYADRKSQIQDKIAELKEEIASEALRRSKQDELTELRDVTMPALRERLRDLESQAREMQREREAAEEAWESAIGGFAYGDKGFKQRARAEARLESRVERGREKLDSPFKTVQRSVGAVTRKLIEIWERREGASGLDEVEGQIEDTKGMMREARAQMNELQAEISEISFEGTLERLQNDLAEAQAELEETTLPEFNVFGKTLGEALVEGFSESMGNKMPGVMKKHIEAMQWALHSLTPDALKGMIPDSMRLEDAGKAPSSDYTPEEVDAAQQAYLDDLARTQERGVPEGETFYPTTDFLDDAKDTIISFLPDLAKVLGDFREGLKISETGPYDLRSGLPPAETVKETTVNDNRNQTINIHEAQRLEETVKRIKDLLNESIVTEGTK